MLLEDFPEKETSRQCHLVICYHVLIYIASLSSPYQGQERVFLFFLF